MSKSHEFGIRPSIPGLRNRRGAADAGVSVNSARVIVTPVMAPLMHPLSKRDVQRILSVLPMESTEGLRSVSLLGDMWTATRLPVFVTYRRQGFIRLHAVSSLPWRVTNIDSATVAELLRYGVHVDADPGESVIHWTTESLRLFYTVGVLLPGVARHRREQETGPESSQIVRSLDAQDGTWQVSDIALEQWRAFLRGAG